MVSSVDVTLDVEVLSALVLVGSGFSSSLTLRYDICICNYNLLRGFNIV